MESDEEEEEEEGGEKKVSIIEITCVEYHWNYMCINVWKVWLHVHNMLVTVVVYFDFNGYLLIIWCWTILILV